MSTAPRTLLLRVARIDYALLRTPLSFASDAAAARLDAGSRVRTTLERSVETLDALAGRLFGNDDAASGPSSPAPAAPPVRVAEPTQAEPEEPPTEPAVTDVEAVTEELLEEQDEKPMAGELSDDDELRRVQAELHAKHLIAEQNEQRSD